MVSQDPAGQGRGPRNVERQLARIEAVLGGHRRRTIPRGDLCPAAVAVPLVLSGGALSVLLTLRTRHVEHHKGEISFPGGRVEPGDPDTLATALRETWEEVGVHPEELRVLGALDDFVSVTGYRVTPYVAALPREGYPFVPQPEEVAEILLVPLGHLRDPRHHRVVEGTGARRRVHQFRWGRHVVWGLTAAILTRFLDLNYAFREVP